MKLLVTGVSGEIGRELTGVLLKEGYSLRAYDRAAGRKEADWEHVPGDIRDLPAIRRAVQGMDAVVHLAAISHDRYGSPEEVYAVNAQGTLNLLQACAEAGIGRLVHFSSVNSLGNFQGRRVSAYFPIDDDYPHHPLSPYQLSKHLSEEACRAYSDQYGMTVICLRPVAVTGPDDCERWRNHPDPRMEERWKPDYWSYVDVRDVCDAVLRSLTAERVTYDALLLAAADTMAVSAETAVLTDRHYSGVPWPKISREAWLAENPHRSLVDCSRAKRTLGWTPRYSWRERR